MKIKLTIVCSLLRKRQLFTIMKTFIFLLCTTVFSLNSEKSFSQEKVTIDMDKTISVEEVFSIIHAQTNYRFLYPQDLFVNAPKVQLKKGVIKVSKLLNQSFSGSHIHFELSKNNTIIIKEKPVIISKSNEKNQSVQITGNVNDTGGQPLPGANILEKGTTNGTQTDFDGKFSLDVSSGNAVIVVSYIGFLTKEIAVNNRTSITITLQEDTAKLDEIVVVGYGTQSRVKLTNAVSSIKAAELVGGSVASFDQALAGQLAGVEITQNSGSPGGASDIKIRGVGTLTAGTRPLIVIDGFPSESLSVSSINPNSIASIDILKDAASAAIYGSRGSNGVILITTKKGKRGDVKYTYDGYSGFQAVSKTVDLQDAYAFGRQVAEARANRGKSPLAHYQPYVIGYKGLTNTNWQDEIFRVAAISDNNFTVSGATDKINFFVSGGYFNQDGIVLGSDYERFNFRANLNFDISEKLKVGVKVAPSYSRANRISTGDHKGNGVVISALLANPTFSPYTSDGSLNLSSDMLLAARVNGQATVENPVALALLNENKRSIFSLLSNAFIEYELFDGLIAKSYGGINYSSSDRNSFSPDTVGAYSVAVDDKKATASESYTKVRNWVAENTLSYTKKIDDVHNLNVLLGHTYQTEDTETTRPKSLPSNEPTIVNGVTISSYPLFEEKWTLISYLARVNYDYNDKYILGASVRRDGSSRFGVNTKWGWFPSVSGAWRISEEDFFKNSVVNEAKLRASWGVTGNNSIPNYGSIALVAPRNYGTTDGTAPITSPNENLSWEQTSTFDIGLDVGLFDNKLSFTADYYNAITNDLLLKVPVPAHSGYTSSLRNIGKVQNTGFEFAIKISKIKLGNVKWSSSFNISTNKNEVLALGPDQDRILSGFHVTEVGETLGSFYLYNKIGVFETQEQIDNAPTQPEQGLGDYIFEDIDGDGKITSADKSIQGDFFPDYTFGFTNTFKYKNLSLKFLIQGKQGYEIFNGTSFFIRNLEGWSNGHASINNHYTPGSTGAEFGHPGKHVKTYENSNLLLEDGSYIRLRKVSLGYTFPKEYLKNTFLDKLKIYVSAKNLFTITNYSGFNPEVRSTNKSFNSSALTPGFDYGAYPVEKSVVLGINLSF